VLKEYSKEKQRLFIFYVEETDESRVEKEVLLFFFYGRYIDVHNFTLYDVVVHGSE
jgi:hypothetical protein